mgnify:CR=1 FL=1
MAGFKTKVTPEIENLTEVCKEHTSLDLSLYAKYDVKRGLRDINGKGVLAGLTQVSNVKATKIVDGKEVPCAGSLSYRGYDIKDLTRGFIEDDRYGFEEVTYLLLFGSLPDKKQLADFTQLLANQRSLPTNFVRDVIMKAPSKDIMNGLSRSVLTLYSYDTNPDDTSLPNVLRQCLNLISVFPLLSVYGYQAYNHYIKDKSLYIHNPKKELTTAENILRMLRPDKKYSHLEAKILDIALILHMEHGGGNNSTFTTRVVTSSGSDTYSAIAAAMSSLKGPKHGGANIKVMEMMDDIRNHVRDYSNKEEISQYLSKILAGEAFDNKGLIYGMGHAVYSLSDPRERVFKGFVEQLAKAKHREEDMLLYNNIETLAPELIAEKRKIYKGVSPNVDFYSGFVYDMLDIPVELYTPIFAIARIVGWSAHRLEEIVGMNKIIRPAYKSVMQERELPCDTL